MGDYDDNNGRNNPNGGVVVRDGGSISYQCPMFTASNYTSWANKRESIMDTQGIWDAIKPPDNTEVDVKIRKKTRAFIFQTLPEYILLRVAKHKDAKEVWDALKIRNLGANRVQKPRIQTLNREFEFISMKESESQWDVSRHLKKGLNLLVKVNPVLINSCSQEQKGKNRLEGVEAQTHQITSVVTVEAGTTIEDEEGDFLQTAFAKMIREIKQEDEDWVDFSIEKETHEIVFDSAQTSPNQSKGNSVESNSSFPNQSEANSVADSSSSFNNSEYNISPLDDSNQSFLGPNSPLNSVNYGSLGGSPVSSSHYDDIPPKGF
ncbi:hypothetical protein E3N88_00239 [Mikania micrantha]|uniref:DUF4219 domain-containing protein n=1 Tax=Mikania micrantha TaxID=192012 RepID=A0A5N6PYC9_9ASTR|nr:hypothetical protein E3N88_00239 [Mikania micrantha]